jgi:hypothetical protein
MNWQPTQTHTTQRTAPPPDSLIPGDHHDVVIRPETGPRARHFALDFQQTEQALATVGIDVFPVQRTGALEAVGQQDRHIVNRWSYTGTLLRPTPLVREVVAEAASRAFGIAAL